MYSKQNLHINRDSLQEKFLYSNKQLLQKYGGLKHIKQGLKTKETNGTKPQVHKNSCQ